MAITTDARPRSRPSHPRLIPVEHVRRSRQVPAGWVRSDTHFVLLVFAAVAFCALVPLVLV